MFAGIAKSPDEFDFISVFNPQNNYYQFTQGLTTIGAQTNIGASILNPTAWQYYAF